MNRLWKHLFLMPPEMCDWVSARSAAFLHGCTMCHHEGWCWHREKTVETYCWGGQHHRNPEQLKRPQAHTRVVDLWEWNSRKRIKASSYCLRKIIWKILFFLTLFFQYFFSILQFPFLITPTWWKEATSLRKWPWCQTCWWWTDKQPYCRST